MERFPDRLKKELKRIEPNGLLRKLETRPGLIDFCSNDYLGFAELPPRTENFPGGSGGSRLLAGNSEWHEKLEALGCEMFRAEACLFFGSGYLANFGLISAIANRSDTIIYDERCHASLKDGMRLSPAKRYPFRHNDLDDLSRKLNKAEGEAYVVTESLFSMEGDLAPLRELQEVVDDHGAWLIVDEAHATGLYPLENGAGYSVECEIENRVFARILTFGKAVGRSGAMVAGSESLKKYLVNRCRSFIYSTAPAPALAYDLIEQLKQVGTASPEREALFRNTRELARLMKLPEAEGRTPIFSFVFPGNANARRAAERLQDGGCYVKPVLSPTVPEGTERLRVVVHAQHSEAQIQTLADALRKAQVELLP